MIRMVLLAAPVVFTFPIWVMWVCEWMVIGGQFLDGVFK